MLLVRDVIASADYFRDKLGFRFDTIYGEPPNFCIAERDGVRIMLVGLGEGKTSTPHWKIVKNTNNAYFWVDDANALYAELQLRGATIDFTIYDTPWGTREFGVQDLDDHDIAFGQVLN